MDYKSLRLLLDPNTMKADPIADLEWDTEQAQTTLRKFNKRQANNIPFYSKLSYLEVGCGNGKISIALGLRGYGYIKGIDVAPRQLSELCARRE